MSAFEQPDDPMVCPQWLADRIGSQDIRIIDATWLLKPEGRIPAQEHLKLRIPGSIFFDIDEIKDDNNPLPHMLPPLEKFCSRMRKAGIGDNVRVIVYDTANMMGAARVWWTFRAFGHEDCAVLDGGFSKWLREKRPVETGVFETRTSHFTARRREDLTANLLDVKSWSEGETRQILDARPADRFRGEAPEPRAGLRSGHIPGSKNLPALLLLNPDGTLKDRTQLSAAFVEADVDVKARLATMCGSGIAASLLALAAARLGNWEVAVYDGSWTEWGARDDLPIAKGTA